MAGKMLTWVVWDASEHKMIYEAKNGCLAQAAAEKAKRENPTHTIILGTIVEVDD